MSFLVISVLAIAQKKTTKSKAKAPAANANPFGGPVTPTKPSTTKSKGNANPFGSNTNSDPFGASSSSADPFGKSASTSDTSKKRGYGSNAPIVVVPTVGNNPLSDSVKVSLRNDNIIEKNLLKDRTPILYDHIREDDAVYKQRIWRVIDAREKSNLCFKYPVEGDNGSQLFFAILYKAVVDGGVTAFEDERFTIPFTKDKFKERFSGGVDTSDVIGLDGETVLRREVRYKEFPVDSIFQFKIKEEVVFDKESSRLITRILGIAPMGPTIVNGKIYSDGNTYPLFWIYYPDARSFLTKYEVYNPKNFGNRMTWEDLFESRMFSSFIVKSTIDNPFDQDLNTRFGKNKLYMLLEGDAIKEKIFNYEQDLWAY